MRDARTLLLTLTLAGLVVLLAAAGGAAADSVTSSTPQVAASPTSQVAASPAAQVAASPAASPPATPSLTLAAAPLVVTAGERVRLTVRLGIPGAAVRLSRQRAGATAPTALATLVTDATGTARYGVSPPANTLYRVDYAGDGAQWLSTSAEVTVSVRPRVTLGGDARVYRGGRAALSVAVRPAHPGGAVTLQLRQDGAWADWRTVKLGARSNAKVAWPSGAVGSYRFRAVVAGDADHAEGASLAHKVAVVKPNPYHVPIDAKSMIVVDISQYRLHFFSNGVEVRSFPCVTGRPSLPTPIGHFRVYARGVWPGGPYGARIMSYHPPCAIHGTNEPQLLSRFPRNFSHGCTRLYNSDAIWLYDRAPVGTPVWNVP